MRNAGRRLEIRTLGEFEIRLDGESLGGFASRKADALLVYLAVTGRTHAREHLATLFWDDRPLGRSLGNLSVLLSSLRQKLDSYLEVDRRKIGISTQGEIWVDLVELRESLREINAGVVDDEPEDADALAEFEQGFALYKGDFLQGFHLREARGFEEWVSLERERALRLVLSGQRELLDAFLKAGDLQCAIHWLRRSLALDPLQEDLHRELMRSLALSGQHSEALAQYQACAAVLRADLHVEPSLATRSLHERILARRERPLDNLPHLTTSLVGRRSELGGIERKFREGRTRLLTLVGAGGIGKTRLAVEAAARLRDAYIEGVWLVDVAPLSDPDLIPARIARALSMPEASTVGKDSSERDLLDQLVDFLESQELLLVLDNCEHLLDACNLVVDRLLRDCSSINILLTSRERLDVSEEQVFLVGPLAIPEVSIEGSHEFASLQENESIVLFVERARAVRSPFSLTRDNAGILIQICRALDGMPLAIELTASRLRSLSLTQIAKQLQERMQSIGHERRGSVLRHQTLETAIDWSYQLLDGNEQRLFRLTTVFRGGFDAEALLKIAQVIDLDRGAIERTLSQLVEKSLIVPRWTGATQRRYSLLEPVRQFGFARMQTDPRFEQALDAHAEYFLDLAERLGPKLHGRERKPSVSLLELDAENLRAALHRHLICAREGACLRFGHALWEGFWLNQGYFREGKDWVDRILEVSREKRDYLYGSNRLGRGAFAWTLGNLDASLDHIDWVLEHAESIGNASLSQWAHYWKAIVIFDRSEFSEAKRLLKRGHRIALEAGEERGAAWCVFYQAQIARVKGQVERAVRLYRQSLEVLEELDVFGAGWCHIYLGHLASEQGELDLAREHLEQGRRLYEELDNPRGLGGAERGLGLVELEAGDLEQAEAHFRRSRRYFERLGWVKMSSSTKIYLGLIATLTDRVEEAAHVLLESLEYQQREGDKHSIAHVLLELGLLAIQLREEEAAMELFSTAEAMQQELGAGFPPHLVSAVEQAKHALAPALEGEPSNSRPWEDVVQRIVSDSPNWLAALAGEMQS